jgi:hypothetical protein
LARDVAGLIEQDDTWSGTIRGVGTTAEPIVFTAAATIPSRATGELPYATNSHSRFAALSFEIEQ